MAVERAGQIEELMKGYHALQAEISAEEGEKLGVLKRIEELKQGLQTLERQGKEHDRRLKGVNEVLEEAEKGYKRVEAAVKSLSSLAQKQTKALRRQLRQVM